MKIDCGIVGLPNVGKSTFFRVLTNMAVKIANFPFCTIQPNIATIQIKDPRIYELTNITKSRSIMHSVIEFIDIAGLIKGAAQGEGLGDKTLACIREVKVLCHVIRCFDDEHIVHIAGNIDPNRDINIVNTELILFDILQCEKNILYLQKNYKVPSESVKQKLFILNKCLMYLNQGVLLRTITLSYVEQIIVQNFNFLTFKPVIYIANVNAKHINNMHLQKLQNTIAVNENRLMISCCAVSLLSYDYNLTNSCFNYISDVKKSREHILRDIVNNIFNILNLRTFFTVNIQMARAWVGTHRITALEAANRVHSDFMKGFIRVQVIKFKDFIIYQGESGVRKAGKVYLEGKEYCIEDGDILKFLFNV